MRQVVRKPAVVLILGMHRSGTSILANALAAAGLPFGDALLSRPVPDNPGGYGEHAEIVAIHEALLERLGRVWHGPDGDLPLPTGWLDWPETLQAREQLRAIVRREIVARSLWAFKDPRTSRLLPLWLPMLEQIGVHPIPVLCIRHPAEVAASLQSRNAMSAELAWRLWTAHQADILAALGCTPVPVVDYGSLLADPESTLTRLLSAVGMCVNSERVRGAADLAAPALRHHVADDDRRSTPALRLYATLRLIADGERLPRRSTPVQAAARAKVTVVMRTRDRPLFLSRAIRSVLAQSFPGWHLVIVNDGGSHREVLDAIEPYRAALADRLSVVRLEQHVGMEAASIRAIRERADPFIAIHDDDDSWSPRFLERCLAEAKRTGAAAVATSSVLVHERVESERIIETRRQVFRPAMTSVTLGEMVEGNLFPPIAFLFRRSAWESLGGFNESLPVLGNWDFNLRLLTERPIDFIPQPLAFWHQRPAGDPYPNSASVEHRRVEAAMHDERLRAAGPQAMAMISTLAPLIERVVRQAVETTSQAAIHDRKNLLEIEQPAQATSDGRPVTRWRLVATQRSQIAQGSGNTLISEGIDPQLLYELGGETLPPGTYHAYVHLSRPTHAGPVELFFSSTMGHSPKNSVVLNYRAGGTYAAAFSSADPIHRLRLDPLQMPGSFEIGALVLDSAAAVSRRPKTAGLPVHRRATRGYHLASPHPIGKFPALPAALQGAPLL